jgi:hypothetical protein
LSTLSIRKILGACFRVFPFFFSFFFELGNQVSKTALIALMTLWSMSVEALSAFSLDFKIASISFKTALIISQS